MTHPFMDRWQDARARSIHDYLTTGNSIFRADCRRWALWYGRLIRKYGGR
jgi:hypothetical protein